jgi:hypothetical protein
MTFPPGGGQGFPGGNVLVNPIVIGSLLFYSPSPGTGNLVASISLPNGGVDQYGNPYPAGISLGQLGNQQVQLLLNGLIGFLNFPSGDTMEGTAANIAAHIEGAGATRFLQMDVSGPKGNPVGATDWVQIEFNSAENNAGSTANLSFVYVDIAGVPHQFGFVDDTGFQIVGSVTAVHPGATPASPAVIESWQSLGAFSTATWTVNVGRYRITSDNPGECELDISLNAQVGGGAAGAFTWANNLPAAYQFPGNYTRAYAMGFNGVITTATNNADVLIDGNGTGNPGRVRVQLPALPATTNATLTARIPLS